jgi:hypothetical protein
VSDSGLYMSLLLLLLLLLLLRYYAGCDADSGCCWASACAPRGHSKHWVENAARSARTIAYGRSCPLRAPDDGSQTWSIPGASRSRES